MRVALKLLKVLLAVINTLFCSLISWFLPYYIHGVQDVTALFIPLNPWSWKLPVYFNLLIAIYFAAFIICKLTLFQRGIYLSFEKTWKFPELLSKGYIHKYFFIFFSVKINRKRKLCTGNCKRFPGLNFTLYKCSVRVILQEK